MDFPRLFAALAFCTSALAQQNPLALTSADYAHAEKFMGYNTTPLVFGASGHPGWMADGRFWYRVLRENGPEFLIVDPAKGGVRTPAFNHTRLAAALSAASGTPLEGDKLPFQSIELSDDSKVVSFSAAGKRWKCKLDDYRCATDTSEPANATLSPNRERAAFIRDYNLWIRQIATGTETQLTTDGVKRFWVCDRQRGLDKELTAPSSCGRPIRKRSRRFNKTSAGWAKCTWSTPPPVTRSWRRGSIRYPATTWSPLFSA